jgi:hypothetical protein
MPDTPMTPGQPVPVFPGGMDIAPELTRSGCQHDACLCPVEPGKHYCSLACARGRSQADVCVCAHYGCSYHKT